MKGMMVLSLVLLFAGKQVTEEEMPGEIDISYDGSEETDLSETADPEEVKEEEKTVQVTVSMRNEKDGVELDEDLQWAYAEGETYLIEVPEIDGYRRKNPGEKILCGIAVKDMAYEILYVPAESVSLKVQKDGEDVSGRLLSRKETITGTIHLDQQIVNKKCTVTVPLPEGFVLEKADHDGEVIEGVLTYNAVLDEEKGTYFTFTGTYEGDHLTLQTEVHDEKETVVSNPVEVFFLPEIRSELRTAGDKEPGTQAVFPGNELTWTISVTNPLPVPAVLKLNPDITGAVCSEKGGTFLLAAEETAQYSFPFTAGEESLITCGYTAEMDLAGDSGEGHVTVLGMPEMKLLDEEKEIVSESFHHQGENFRGVISLANTTSETQDLLFMYTVPEGIRIEETANEGWREGDQIFWSVSAGAGETVSVSFTACIETAGISISQQASVSTSAGAAVTIPVTMHIPGTPVLSVYNDEGADINGGEIALAEDTFLNYTLRLVNPSNAAKTYHAVMNLPDTLILVSAEDGTLEDGRIVYDFELEPGAEKICRCRTKPDISCGPSVISAQAEIQCGDYAEKTLTVTNTTIETMTYVTLSGHIEWDDADNKDKIRPNTVRVHVYAGEEEIKSVQVLKTEEGMNFTVDDLPEYADGEQIVYSLREDTPGGYQASSGTDGDSFVITYAHEAAPDPTPVPTAVTTPEPVSYSPDTGDDSSLLHYAVFFLAGLGLCGAGVYFLHEKEEGE